MLTIKAIEIDLSLPSMVYGKKGFQRVLRACENVLNRSVTWLCHDHRTKEEGAFEDLKGPIGM